MELEHLENMCRETINAMSDAIHVINRDFQILIINETFKEWTQSLGLDFTVVEGMQLFDAFPFLREKIRDEYMQVFESGKTLIVKRPF